MSTITAGQRVVVRDAFGHVLNRVAVTDIVRGHDFPVVWIAHVDEWEASQAEHREPEAVPFPAEDVAENEACLT